jgi:solute carrier family 25 carnitine/acylcarnitine transporter 20/29
LLFWDVSFINLFQRIYIFINTPSEVIKCRQQLNVDKFISFRETAKDVYQIDGLKGYYRGLCVSANRDIISFGIYFYVYYKLKEYWESKKSLSNLKLMLAGGLAGVCAWLSTYPFDTLKTIIQVNTDKKTLTQLEAFNILKKNTNSNFISLYNGLSPTLFRSFYTNAVIFYSNELCQNYLNKL